MTEATQTTLPETPTALELSGVLEVSDLDTFVRYLVSWHSEKVALVKHMLEVPDGAKFKIGEDEPILLSGETLTTFKLGVQMALMELATLPFVADVEDDEPTPDTAG